MFMERSEMAICLFCEKEFVKKNKNHKFCSADCRYCWNTGKNSDVEGMSYRERSEYYGLQVKAVDLEPPPQKKPGRKPIKPDLPDNWGYVYLVKSENNLYKIGRTINIEARRAGIERDIPIKTEMIHYFLSNYYIKAEQVLHKQYEDSRIKYEWFDLSTKQVNEILAIKDNDLDTLIKELYL